MPRTVKSTNIPCTTGPRLIGRVAASAGVSQEISVGTGLSLTGSTLDCTVSGGVTDHGALTGLSDDDHTQYALLAGRSGGQTINGDTASAGKLMLAGSAHSTKGPVCAVATGSGPSFVAGANNSTLLTNVTNGIEVLGPIGALAGMIYVDGSSHLVTVQFSGTLLRWREGSVTGNVPLAVDPFNNWTRIGSSGAQITSILSATATLDFGSISAGGTAELTITVTGAATGNDVLLGPPSGIEAGLMWAGYVSATNTVTVRLHNTTGSPIDPASATWRATVVKI